MSLNQNLLDFRASIRQQNRHIGFAHNTDVDGNYTVEQDLREFISESAYLRIFVSWETFLERSFIDYLVNEQSIDNKRPAKWVSPIDIDHANNIIIGNQKHMDWSNPEAVRKISKLFFHLGYVFDSVLSSINADLLDMKTIRNSAAHISSTTTTKLDGIASRILGTTMSNVSSYQILFANDPRDTSKTVLERYLSLIDVAAEQIAKG